MNGRHAVGRATMDLLMLAMGCGKSGYVQTAVPEPSDTASGKVQIVVTKAGYDVDDSKGLDKTQIEQKLAGLQARLKADGCMVRVEPRCMATWA